MTTEFHLKKGDRKPGLQQTLSDDGGALNLTGCTVQLRLTAWETGQVRTSGGGGLAGVASVVTAAEGVVQFDWGAGDTDTVGLFDAEWIVTYPGSLPRTVPSIGAILLVVED